MPHPTVRICVATTLLLMAAGCLKPAETAVLERRGDSEDREPDGQPESDTDPGSPVPVDNGRARPAASPGVCVNGGLCSALEPDAPPMLDVLFVIDNSTLIAQEQAALRNEFPTLIAALSSGRSSDGSTHPPVHDIHLGVVSTDMGLPGIPNDIRGCGTQLSINGGDDGRLQHPGRTGPGCAEAYPQFLSYHHGDDPGRVAQDLGCIASIGTAGCSIEQPLEAALKALWPKQYVDASGSVYPPEKNPVLFLSTTQENQYGRGDVPEQLGGNFGFLRRDPIQGVSHLAIVVLTDNDDCSSKSTAHFLTTDDPENPLSRQAPRLRCFYNKQNLFELDRYVRAFQSLRPNYPDRVSFAAIVGVPPDLVDDTARADVDFTNELEREAYYERILNDPRMLERPRNENVPEIANLAPSCDRLDSTYEPQNAYPPRRIVEVARRLGTQGLIQSICQDDFSPAIDAIVTQISTGFEAECLDRDLVRGHDGRVKCDVIWELPPSDGMAEGPFDCSERPFLANVESPRRKTNARGGRNCEVKQLPVTVLGKIPIGEGFYYDDFTEYQASVCTGRTRLAFSAGAAVPLRVNAVLDCSKDAD